MHVDRDYERIAEVRPLVDITNRHNFNQLFFENALNFYRLPEAEKTRAVTILRGRVIAERGKLLGSTSDGQLLLRKLDPQVLQRPVC